MTKKTKAYKNKFEQMLAYELGSRVCRALLEHLSEGHSSKSFYFITEGFRISYSSLSPYMKNHEDLFPPEEIQFAETQGHKKWEKIVFDAALGKYQGHSAPLIQMIMRNKYDWDKDTRNKEEVRPVTVNVLPVPK